MSNIENSDNNICKYCVFYHDKKFHKYFIYYSNDTYEETDEKPDKIDNFEHSRLTKHSINDKLKEGVELKEILKEYSDKILIWRNEILSSKTLIKKFDYFQTFNKDNGEKFMNTNESNILRFFKAYSSKIYTADKMDLINWNEYKWFEKSNNGALMRCIAGVYETIGYDFKMAYPNILSSELEVMGNKQTFYFPMKQGKEEKVKTLTNLKYGLYHAKISSDNKDFLFIFEINGENVYSHYEIIFCQKYKELFNISIELIIDNEYNALTFLNCHLVDGKNIFKMWLERIKDLKTEFKDNGLIKLLSSSIWGYLSKTNKRFYNDIELDANPEITFDFHDRADINYLCMNEKDNKNGSTDYLLVNKEKPYSKNYRIKSFIQPFTRLILAEIAIKIGINKIVRINTDNITFNKDLLTDKDIQKLKRISPQFIQEDKTTGTFDILNINNFVRLD